MPENNPTTSHQMKDSIEISKTDSAEAMGSVQSDAPDGTVGTQKDNIEQISDPDKADLVSGEVETASIASDTQTHSNQTTLNVSVSEPSSLSTVETAQRPLTEQASNITTTEAKIIGSSPNTSRNMTNTSARPLTSSEITCSTAAASVSLPDPPLTVIHPDTPPETLTESIHSNVTETRHPPPPITEATLEPPDLKFSTKRDVEEFMRAAFVAQKWFITCPYCTFITSSRAPNIGNYLRHLKAKHDIVPSSNDVEKTDDQKVPTPVLCKNYCTHCKRSFDTNESFCSGYCVVDRITHPVCCPICPPILVGKGFLRSRSHTTFDDIRHSLK